MGRAASGGDGMMSATASKLGKAWRAWLGALQRRFQCDVLHFRLVSVPVRRQPGPPTRPGFHRFFTLAECLVALALVMLVLVAAEEMAWMSLGVRISAERRARGAQLLNNRLELVRNFTYAQLLQAVEVDTLVNQDGVPDPKGLFRRTTQVTAGDDWNDDTKSEDYLVRVSITFRSAIRPNPFQTITGSTYVMNHETLTPLWSKP